MRGWCTRKWWGAAFGRVVPPIVVEAVCVDRLEIVLSYPGRKDVQSIAGIWQTTNQRHNKQIFNRLLVHRFNPAIVRNVGWNMQGRSEFIQGGRCQVNCLNTYWRAWSISVKVMFSACPPALAAKFVFACISWL